MISHFNAIILDMTLAMFLMLSFTIINGMSVSNDEIVDGATTYSASKMPELNYYDKYDELKAEFQKLIDEVNWNEMIYQSTYSFLPVLSISIFLSSKKSDSF